jgi:poly[(R)-3-hydroxyalkanoate] polymerase subunit PhaC
VIGIVDSAANLFDMLPIVGGGVADLTRVPSSVIDEGPQRRVHRYRGPRRHDRWRNPVLLVTPLAAPPSCFDLRRGCSLVEHLTALGYPTYLVDYGPIAFSDRQLGLEHWVDDVIPKAIAAVSEDSGEAVQVVGWSLGGIMALLGVASRRMPVRSVTLIGSPFDFEQVELMAPIRQLADLTGGRLVTALYRALGGAPAPLVSIGFQLTAIDRRIKKPLTIARHIDDRDYLAQVEAVDDYMAHMLAYPGRTFGQLYHQFFRVNELAGGTLRLSDREIRLEEVEVPVLSIAGTSDVLAPVAAVHHVGKLLKRAPEVRLETAPGGHLGVLTGRGARDTTWRYLAEFLNAHDSARPAKPPPSASARGRAGRRESARAAS